MNVIYKTVREFRILDNKALSSALDLCMTKDDSKLWVVYSKSNIGNWRGKDLNEKDSPISKKVLHFLDDQISKYKEEIEQLTESELIKKHNIKIEFIILETNNSVRDIYNFAMKNKVTHIFTDYTPMKEQRVFFDKFKTNIANGVFQNIEIEELDSRNILNIKEVSDKEEFSAATFRRKWNKVLKNKLEENETFLSVEKIQNKYLHEKYLQSDEAIQIFENFLSNKVQDYFTERNNALSSGQSNLSAFINLGRISRRFMLSRILDKFNLTLNDIFDENRNGSSNLSSNNLLSSIRSFVEEMCIRYELAENYCYYNSNYNNLNGAKDWAKLTLKKALTDKREYLYTRDQFENAETHDELWNACQKDLELNGKLNGYLRMYWCKKILQWTNTPEEAISIAIYLNDKYALDGYAPPTYTGILWSIAGLHDRAWFPRPVFGNIRYMAQSGVEKRMKVEEYLKKISLL